MKWDFEKLDAAENERTKKHDADWNYEDFKLKEKDAETKWWIDRNDAYQEGFETLLAEAGWTRREYCDEYEDRIGYEIAACHPSYLMTSSQKVLAGLKLLVKADKDCSIRPYGMDQIWAYSDDWSQLSKNDHFDLLRYDFESKLDGYFVAPRSTRRALT